MAPDEGIMGTRHATLISLTEAKIKSLWYMILGSKGTFFHMYKKDSKLHDWYGFSTCTLI